MNELPTWAPFRWGLFFFLGGEGWRVLKNRLHCKWCRKFLFLKVLKLNSGDAGKIDTPLLQTFAITVLQYLSNAERLQDFPDEACFTLNTVAEKLYPSLLLKGKYITMHSTLQNQIASSTLFQQFSESTQQ